jgi:hypothetical protein
MLAVGAFGEVLAFGGAASDTDCLDGKIGVVVPAFAGGDREESLLGQQVATMLNLQIWQTLRRADELGDDFGSGVAIWDPEPLAEQTFEAAEEKAREKGCQLVFWGQAWSYGEDVVAQIYLSILDESALWRTEVELAGGRRPFELGFPRRRYEFAPIVLKPEVVARFSQPSALKLWSDRNGTGLQGVLGEVFIAIRQERNAAFVESDGRLGWILLPELSDERSEVVEFTSSIMRILRQDWRGARDLLQRVIDNPVAPMSLVIDSLILQGVVSERLGENGWPMIERAYSLNEHSRITARYGLMHRLSRLEKRRSGGQGAANESRALEEALADTQSLFAPDDPWVVDARLALAPP